MTLNDIDPDDLRLTLKGLRVIDSMDVDSTGEAAVAQYFPDYSSFRSQAKTSDLYRKCFFVENNRKHFLCAGIDVRTNDDLKNIIFAARGEQAGSRSDAYMSTLSIWRRNADNLLALDPIRTNNQEIVNNHVYIGHSAGGASACVAAALSAANDKTRAPFLCTAGAPKSMSRGSTRFLRLATGRYAFQDNDDLVPTLPPNSQYYDHPVHWPSLSKLQVSAQSFVNPLNTVWLELGFCPDNALHFSQPRLDAVLAAMLYSNVQNTFLHAHMVSTYIARMTRLLAQVIELKAANSPVVQPQAPPVVPPPPAQNVNQHLMEPMHNHVDVHTLLMEPMRVDNGSHTTRAMNARVVDAAHRITRIPASSYNTTAPTHGPLITVPRTHHTHPSRH